MHLLTMHRRIRDEKARRMLRRMEPQDPVSKENALAAARAKRLRRQERNKTLALIARTTPAHGRAP